MGKLYLEVVTPAKIAVSQEVDIVVAPGSLGEFGILENHEPYLTGIVPGELRYSSGGKIKYMAVTAGFAEVSYNKISVLVDAAEDYYDINVDRAMDAKRRAEERLAMDRGIPDIDFIRAEAALKRALIRIKVSEKNT